MKKYVFIILLILFLCPNVYAIDIDVTSSITSPNSSTTGRYQGTEIYNTGSDNIYTVNTRYSGRLSRIRYNLPLPDSLGQCFSTNNTYTITMNMATDDWRNHFGSIYVGWGSNNTNWSTGGITYVSHKKIYFKFKIPASDTNCYDFVYIDLRSPDVSNTAFTGVSNWNLSKITLTDPTFITPSTPAPATPTPPPDYSSIINNQNQNTESIINNNTQNTENIINTQNQNTQDIIDNNNANAGWFTDTINNALTYPCPNIMEKLNNSIKSDGVSYSEDLKSVVVDFSNNNDIYFMIYKFSLQPIQSYTLSFNATGVGSSNIRYYVYTPDPVFYNLREGINTITIPIGTPLSNLRLLFDDVSQNDWATRPTITFTDFILSSGTDYQPYCAFGSQVSKLDSQTDAINKVNDSINNSGIDDKTGFFSNFENNTHGLTGIITLPLTTIQGLANTSCVSLDVPIPYTNSNVSLPCMSTVYQTYIPTVYSIWQVVSFGLISYFICLDIFKLVKGFKDPNEDKVEVLDL